MICGQKVTHHGRAHKASQVSNRVDHANRSSGSRSLGDQSWKNPEGGTPGIDGCPGQAQPEHGLGKGKSGASRQKEKQACSQERNTGMQPAFATSV